MLMSNISSRIDCVPPVIRFNSLVTDRVNGTHVVRGFAATGCAVTSYAYSPDGLLSAVSNDDVTVAYRYDHLGRRVQKIAPDGTHTFLYDGWRPVVETVASTSGGTDRIEYYWGKDLSGSLDGAAGVGGLLYVKRNGAICVPFYDAFGNVMGYWDELGNVVAEYAYDAFGRTVAKSGIMTDGVLLQYGG